MSSWLPAVATQVLQQMQELRQLPPALPNQVYHIPNVSVASWIHGAWSSAFTDPYHHLWDASTFVLWGF